MQLIYIIGLEHSGTTLADHLLSRYQGVLGLGEIYSFLSPEHMRDYFSRWGKHSDARYCSCGRRWDSCEFWSSIGELRGDLSDGSLVEKYSRLVEHVKFYDPKIEIVVDSSKSLSNLERLDAHIDEIGFDKIHPVMVVKDPRSFATSIGRKAGRPLSLANVVRTFRWWSATNRNILSALERRGRPWTLFTYERLCNHADDMTYDLIESINNGSSPRMIAGSRTHIAMGNKNFALRNSDRIRYDQDWFYENRVNTVYPFMFRLAEFNEQLRRICESQYTNG